MPGPVEVVWIPIDEYLARGRTISTERADIIDRILRLKYEFEAVFARACREAGVRMDEGRSLALAEQAVEVARAAKAESRTAKWLAIAAGVITLALAVAKAFEYLWPHIERLINGSSSRP